MLSMGFGEQADTKMTGSINWGRAQSASTVPGMYFLGVYSDTTYDRRMDKPKPRMPVLATACCAIFSILAMFAVLTHHPFLTFYFGFGFLAVVVIVWLRNRRNPNI
jgi:hypothetical protein